MQIEGFFGDMPLSAAYVRAAVEIPSLGLKQSVKFLIDTGAARTTILDRDAIDLKIDYSRLSKSHTKLLGLGGLLDTYSVKGISLHFIADQKDHVEHLAELLILRHDNIDQKTLAMPSILGRDILNKYRLTYDKRNLIVTITDD